MNRRSIYEWQHVPIGQAETRSAEGDFDSYHVDNHIMQSCLSQNSTTTPSHYERTGYWAFYLRRRILAVFLGTFAGFIVILQTLLAVSDRHHGLGESEEKLHYLWTYGPTAFLTLIAALWARVVCQAKILAPWERMIKGSAEPKRSVLLDYLSTWQPKSIFEALRNLDYTVAAASTNLMVCKILIIISTALITLSPVAMLRSEIPLLVTSEFVDSVDGFVNAPLAYYAFRGIVDLRTSGNDGLTTDYAYQLVQPTTPNTTQFMTTVDGFSAGLDCEDAEIGLTDSRRAVINQTDYVRLDVDLTSANCQMKTKVLGPSAAGQLGVPYNFYRFVPATCNGTSTNKDDFRVAAIFAAINYTDMALVQHVTQPSIQDIYNITSRLLPSRGLICKPTYNIQPVQLEKNDSQTIVSITRDSEPTQLSHVHAWDIMTAHFSSFQNLLNSDSKASSTTNYVLNITRTPSDVDGPMGLAFEFANMTGELPEAESLLQDANARRLITAYYQQYAAVIAHTMLMQKSSATSKCFAYVMEDRLVVRALAAHLMTGFLVFAMGLVLVVIFTRPHHAILPQDPSTPIGIAAALSRSKGFIHSLHGMGSANKTSLREQLNCWEYEAHVDDGGQFCINTTQRLPSNDDLEVREGDRHQAHPRSLHPILRVSVYLLILGIIATLIVTLRFSRANNGLDDIGDGDFVHYFWTTMPAIVITIFGMYFAGVDFDVKSLTPYANLKRGASFQKSVGLDLINRFTLFTILKEIETRSYAALACTITVALTSILTIFTSSLFYPTSVPTIFPAQLGVRSLVYNGVVDSTNDPDGQGLLAASLIFDSNLSYPAFTYEDLVFPEMELDLGSGPQDWSAYNTSNFVTNTTISAVRPRLSCKIYEPSQILTNISIGNEVTRTFSNASTNTSLTYRLYNPLSVVIDGELCNVPSDSNSNLMLDMGKNTSRSGFFGYGDTTLPGAMVTGCSDFLYMWGSWRLTADGRSVDFLSGFAMGCNESLESVDVSATLFGADLRIKPDYPPVANDQSAKNIAIPANIKHNNIYYRLASLSGSMGASTLNNFFTTATRSRYAIPVESLGDASRMHDVANEIQFHHRIIRAQIASSGYRGPVIPRAGEVSADLHVVGALNDTLSRQAMVTDTASRQRVVQDPVSTYIIVALLVATLLCSIAGWLLMRETDVLPQTPTSIGSVAALFADGNIFDHLPDNAPWLTKAELAKAFSQVSIFKLGWRPSSNGSEERFAVRVEVHSSEDENQYLEDQKSYRTDHASSVDSTAYDDTLIANPWSRGRGVVYAGPTDYSHVSEPYQEPAIHQRTPGISDRSKRSDMEDIPVLPVSSRLPIQTWDDYHQQSETR